MRVLTKKHALWWKVHFNKYGYFVCALAVKDRVKFRVSPRFGDFRLDANEALLKIINADDWEVALVFADNAADDFLYYIDNPKVKPFASSTMDKQPMICLSDTTPEDAAQMLRQYLRSLKEWRYTQLLEVYKTLNSELTGTDREVLRIITE